MAEETSGRRGSFPALLILAMLVSILCQALRESGHQAVEIPLAMAFAACLALRLRQLPAWRTRLGWLGTILLGGVATGIPMAAADALVIAQVDAGSAWFRPVLGYSLPVLAVNTLTLAGLYVWYVHQDQRQLGHRS